MGGNNHFDIYVFRNVGMYGYGKRRLQNIFFGPRTTDRNIRTTVENAKYRIIREFIDFMQEIPLGAVKSNIDTHAVQVKIMSGVCQSSANMHAKTNPLVMLPL